MILIIIDILPDNSSSEQVSVADEDLIPPVYLPHRDHAQLQLVAQVGDGLLHVGIAGVREHAGHGVETPQLST